MGRTDLELAINQVFLLPTLVVPQYDSTDWLRLNPTFKLVHTHAHTHDDGTKAYQVFIHLPASHFAPALRHAHEYITDPPCRSMALARMAWNKKLDCWCVLENHQYFWADNYEGLKVEDLLAVRDQMNLAEPPSWRLQTAAGLEVVATFIVESLSKGECDAVDQAYLLNQTAAIARWC